MRTWRVAGMAVAVFVLAASTVALALGARQAARNDAAGEQARQLDRAASAIASTLQTTLLRADDAAAFTAGRRLDAREWQRVRERLFADPALFGAGEALAFPDRERSAVERRLGGRLREPGPGGTLRPARRRALYVVPIFVAYRGGGTAGRGVNLAAEPQRLATLQRAALVGGGQLTAPVVRVGSSKDMIVVVYSPIHAGPSGGRPGEVTGYVIASYRTSQLIKRVQSVLGRDVRFRLSDGATAFGGSAVQLANPSFRSLPIGGRRLQLAVGRPAASYSSAIAIATGGAVITLLVALLLFQAVRGERRALAGREALRASELRYRTVVSGLGEGVIVHDADGVIESCNPAAEKILGVSADQLTRRTLSDLPWMAIHEDGTRFGEEDHPAMVTLRTGEPQRGVIMGIGKADGSLTWISAEANMLRPHGDPAGAAVFTAFADITEQRNADRRLRARTVELERLNHELESFAYSVSHDLRAPLRAIDGFSQMLLTDYGEQLGPDGRHYLERIRAGVVRMGDLIEGILQLSRLSRRPFKRQPVDISDLARQVAAELQLSQPERHVEFDIQEGLADEADPGLLRAVLVNLFGNAYKFTAKTSQPRIRFGANEQDGIRVYFVADNGIGFDIAHAAQLFQPFHRLHRDNEFAGEGIGLATVARAIHRHGGAVWAESAVGTGATFHFSLMPGTQPPHNAVSGADEIPLWPAEEAIGTTIDDRPGRAPDRGARSVASEMQPAPD